MRRWAPLNDLQLRVLRLVAACADLSGPAQGSMRTSAAALRSRGLIVITRQAGRWNATITEAGKFYLEHGHHPEYPAPDRLDSVHPRSTAHDPEQATPAMVERDSIPGAPDPDTPVPVSRQRRQAAEALMTQLKQHRSVTVPIATSADIDLLRKVLDFARRHQLVPPGHHVVTARTADSARVSLVTGTHPNARLPPSSEQSETRIDVRSLHSIVEALRDDSYRLMMPPPIRDRAVLILQLVAIEARRRGYSLHGVSVEERHYIHHPTAERPGYARREGQIGIEINNVVYLATIRQRSPEATDSRSERLSLEMPQWPDRDRQYRWADGTTRRVEFAVSEALDTLEIFANEDQQHRAAQEHHEQQQRAATKSAATERRLAGQLMSDLDDWTLANQLRSYCAALEDRIDQALPDSDPTVSNARRWLAWSRAYIDQIDPLTSLRTPAMSASPHMPRL